MRIFTACGTGQAGVDHIAWPGWGAAVTEGEGFAYVDDCQPDCASGGLHYAPAEIYLSVLKHCPNGRLQYTNVTIAVEAGPGIVGGPSVAARLAGSYTMPCVVNGQPSEALSAAETGS